MFVDKREAFAFLLSGLTVILFIIAIIVFIKYGAHSTFYGIMIVALAAGVANAWMITRIGVPSRTPSQPASVRPTTRRPSAKKRRRKQ
jgi:hypothetical protein